MIIFAQYKFLALLLLAPLFLVAYAIMRGERRRRAARFGESPFTDALMPSYSGAKGWVRVVLFTLAFIFFVIGLARPQMGATLKEHKARKLRPGEQYNGYRGYGGSYGYIYIYKWGEKDNQPPKVTDKQIFYIMDDSTIRFYEEQEKPQREKKSREQLDGVLSKLQKRSDVIEAYRSVN